MYQNLKKDITDNKVKSPLKHKEQRKFFSLFLYLVKKLKLLIKKQMGIDNNLALTYKLMHNTA